MRSATIKTLLVSSAAPRGLIAVRAQERTQQPTMAQLADAFEAFKAKHEERYSEIEAAMDAQAKGDAASRLNGLGSGDEPRADPEYRKTFASYAQRGAAEAEAKLTEANSAGERAAIRAAMSEGDNSSGGYLAPVEWDRQIRNAQVAISPMRRIARSVQTGVNGYSTLWNTGAWGSGWVGETANRPQTSSTTLLPVIFPVGEIYAMPAATQRLIDDSAINFEEWIGAELGTEFSRQEAIAFVSGDGVNKPMGFLQYLPGGAASAAILDGEGDVVTPATAGAHPGGNLGITPSGEAAAITLDSLINIKYALGSAYRQTAVWLMNSSTAAAIAKMKDGDGNLIWRESLMAGQPATLLGSPVEIDEGMPNVAAGAYPIAFGDFAKGYLINDRIGVRILRDPYTAKPFVLFYATKRVGGGVLDPNAIRVLKVGVS